MTHYTRASLQFFGHGFLDYYKPGPPPVPMKESAVFRKASLQISKILNHGLAPAPADRGPWPDTVTTVPNSAGQVCAPGDSGGPSFFFDGTDYRLAATTVSGDWDCADGTTYLTCKSTITNIKACRANRLDKRFTEEIIAASWNPNATTSTFVASAALYRLEAIYWDTSGADLVDPGARSWDVALRGASEMCYDRGFIGGHFTGKTPSTPAWEYVCSGSSAAYMDASSADILASGFNFTTLAVNWAQAYRAASTICATRFPSSVGGHFKGVATAGFSAPGTIPSTIGSIGLVCYLPPNERYLIPDVGRIFPHLKPDDYKWTTATQIAARICAERAL